MFTHFDVVPAPVILSDLIEDAYMDAIRPHCNCFWRSTYWGSHDAMVAAIIEAWGMEDEAEC